MIRVVILTLMMAAVWVSLTDFVTIESFLIGVVLSLSIIVLISRFQDVPRWSIGGVVAALIYLTKLVRDILAADIEVARQVISPNIKPGFVEIPIGAESEAVAAISGHGITVTPGSFVVDYTDDGKMIVHMLDVSAEAQLIVEQEERAKLCGRMVHKEDVS